MPDDTKPDPKRATILYDVDDDRLEGYNRYPWARRFQICPLTGIEMVLVHATPDVHRLFGPASEQPLVRVDPAEDDAIWDEVRMIARDRMLLGAAVVAFERRMTRDQFRAAALQAFDFVHLSQAEDSLTIH